MGWYYTYGSKAEDVRKELLESTPAHLNLIGHATTAFGRRLWIVYEQKNDGGRFIMLFLIQERKGEAGYKDIDESMGPYYFDCPLSLLDLAEPRAEGITGEWRTAVRNAHAHVRNQRRLTRHLQVGDQVTLRVGYRQDSYRLASLNPLLGVGADGRLYRIPKKAIDTIVTKEAAHGAC